MLPRCTIVINNSGKIVLEGQEHSDNCMLLEELVKKAGKITKNEYKEHGPQEQYVNLNS